MNPSTTTSVMSSTVRDEGQPASRPEATPADRVAVAEVMTKVVFCAKRDTSIELVMNTMLERGYSGVPVVDDENRPIGVVTKTDLLREQADGAWGQEHRQASKTESEQLGHGFHPETLTRATVGEVMTPLAFSVEDTFTVSQAAALMAYQRVHRVPVVNQSNVVVGLLSALDVLRWLGECDGYLTTKPLT